MINKEALNPFENFTHLKEAPSQCQKANAKYPYQHHKMSMDSGYGDDESISSLNQISFAEKMQQKRCLLFVRKFEYFLRNFYNFVIESENTIYRNYIHHSGIAVIRIYHTVSIRYHQY